ncbi:MAG TPA: DUF2157 domain-containing protein [Chryseolinea sp.]|nr:DUF2157 domain-containing protein [Chryseolinea sp.]
MSKQILRALPELVQAGIIDEATAERVKVYYDHQGSASGNRLFVVFGILGAMLVGMGIVLILAHNWDDLSRSVRVTIGILPLLAGQILAGRLIFKGIDNRTWREGTGAFLFCAIGVCLSVVSQAYNMGGDLADFLLTWMCLAVPIIYVLGSGTTAMLCIAGITWYGCELSYFTYLGSHAAPMYWAVIASILPNYYYTYLRPQLKNNFYVLISWLLVLSLTICLATVGENTGRLFLIAYVSLFSAFVIAGESDLFQTGRVLSNSFLVVGSLGVVAILLTASFVDFWDWESNLDVADYSTLGIVMVALMTLIAASALVVHVRSKGVAAVNTKAYAFLFFIAVYFIGAQSAAIGALLMNLGILVLAVYTIRSGAQQNHLGILNYGLLIITALILCRFFDTDLSFVVRGLLFIGVGVGFFGTNYYLIKQRRGNT